jgi:hypothetical protein
VSLFTVENFILVDQSIPEPSSLLMIVAGGACLALRRMCSKKA